MLTDCGSGWDHPILWQHLNLGKLLYYPHFIYFKIMFSGYSLVFLLTLPVRPRGAALRASLHPSTWAFSAHLTFHTLPPVLTQIPLLVVLSWLCLWNKFLYIKEILTLWDAVAGLSVIVQTSDHKFYSSCVTSFTSCCLCVWVGWGPWSELVSLIFRRHPPNVGHVSGLQFKLKEELSENSVIQWLQWDSVASIAIWFQLFWFSRNNLYHVQDEWWWGWSEWTELQN